MQFSKESNQHISEALPVIDSRLAELGEATHAMLSTLDMMLPEMRSAASGTSANDNVVASHEATPSAVASAPVEPKPVVAEQPTSPAVTPITSAPSYRPPESVTPTDTIAIDAEGNFLASARQQINDAYDGEAA